MLIQRRRIGSGTARWALIGVLIAGCSTAKEAPGVASPEEAAPSAPREPTLEEQIEVVVLPGQGHLRIFDHMAQMLTHLLAV